MQLHAQHLKKASRNAEITNKILPNKVWNAYFQRMKIFLKSRMFWPVLKVMIFCCSFEFVITTDQTINVSIDIIFDYSAYDQNQKLESVAYLQLDFILNVSSSVEDLKKLFELENKLLKKLSNSSNDVMKPYLHELDYE